MLVFQFEDERTDPSRTRIKHKQFGDDRWETADFWPYFYVDHAEGYRLPDSIPGRVERDIDARAYDGTRLDRVVLHTTRDARDARDAADNHFEADIPYERRYYIDEVEGSLTGGGDITGAEPHILHVDIEVWADGGRVDPLDASEPVISIAAYSEDYGEHLNLLLKPDGWDPASSVDDRGREYISPGWADGDRVYLFDTETAMLGAFARIIKRSGVEVMTGWNVEGYDATYLIKRAERLRGITENVLSPLGESYVSVWTTDDGEQRRNATIKGIDIFDMFLAYKHLKRREGPPNWRLGTVAEHEGVEVDKIDLDAARIGPTWERDPLEVMRYNRRDARLTHEIAASLGAFDLFLEMHRAFAIPLSDTLNNSVLVEMYVMSRAPRWGIRDRILDSKRTEVNDFEGGRTIQPRAGKYDWAFSVDVTSEYPNWVRAANLSPETVVLEGDERYHRGGLIDSPVDGIRFLPHHERLGILPRAVDEMFQMKEEKTEQRSRFDYGTPGWKQADMERDATKWFLNSIQGVTGMETHRLSKNEVSASITAFGRETVEYMRSIGEKAGYEFIYGDTDSTFFHDPTGERVDGLQTAVGAARELSEAVNSRLPEWARTAYGIEDDRRFHLETEPDKVARRAFFPNRKKRYSLILSWSDGDEVGDKVTHTGWHTIRSDTSTVEERVQRKTLEAVLHDKDEGYVTDRLKREMRAVVDGEHGPMDIARPQGSAKPFDRYGSNDGRLDLDGVPYFVAAMLSSNELLGTDYRGGDKAYMLPVRETESVQLNGTTNNVNYLAIDETVDLPDWVEMDYAKALDNVISKVRRIYESLGWDLSPLEAHRRELVGEADAARVAAQHHTLGSFSS